MPTGRNKLRLVMFQIREQQTPMLQEQRCVIERCGVARGQIRFINVPDNPDFSWRDVEDAHAMLIGGAGAYSATQTHPFSERLGDIVLEAVEHDRPIFGSCWGHQFMGGLIGGKVIKDMDRSEIGTFDLELTDEGRRDPLSSYLPQHFPVQLGHHDLVEPLGNEWVELAASALCPNQLIRLRDKPVYGTQFHSEMNEARLHERLTVYKEDYAPDDDYFNEIISNLRPSTEADQLMSRFLDLYA